MEETDWGIHHLFFSWDRKESAQEIFNMFRNGKTIPEIKQHVV